MTEDAGDNLQTLEGARSVLLEVAANDSIRDEHAFIAPLCDEKVLGRIVELAWRHQFADDRYGFKRDIRELQEMVALKAKESTEADA